MLVFYEEIDNVLNADLRIVQAPKQGETAYRSLAEIQAAAVAAMPPQAKLGFIDYPAEATSSYKFGAVTRRVETMSPSFGALLPLYPKGCPCWSRAFFSLAPLALRLIWLFNFFYLLGEDFLRLKRLIVEARNLLFFP